MDTRRRRASARASGFVRFLSKRKLGTAAATAAIHARGGARGLVAALSNLYGIVSGAKA